MPLKTITPLGDFLFVTDRPPGDHQLDTNHFGYTTTMSRCLVQVLPHLRGRQGAPLIEPFCRQSIRSVKTCDRVQILLAQYLVAVCLLTAIGRFQEDFRFRTKKLLVDPLLSLVKPIKPPHDFLTDAG